MSLWSKAKKAAKKVAQAAHTVVNTVTEVAADVVETTGNAVESGLNKLASGAEGIPGVGGALATFGRYSGRVFAGATDMAAAAVKTSGNLLGATVAGAILTTAGFATLNPSLIVDGFRGITAALFGGVLLFGGKALAGISALFPGVEQREPLTEEQKKLLRRVFRDSVALHNVRVVKSKYGAGLLASGNRPFTLGNVIYLKSRNVSKEPELLVHECTHVWQFQNLGAQYTSEAVHAQWLVPDAYSWEREIQRGNDKWSVLNREAQASLLENIYTDGELVYVPSALLVAGLEPGGSVAPIPAGPPPVKGSGVFYDANPPDSFGLFRFNSSDPKNRVDRTNLASESVEAVRSAMNARLSGGLD
jgi:hypothetical protein